MSALRGMNFVKAKRILTGHPDDRKNVFSFTGPGRQKMADRKMENRKRVWKMYLSVRHFFVC
jgi:hypothetical protein